MSVNDNTLDGSGTLLDYETPNPHPSRAVYGFALFLCSWFFLPLYLIWAFVPTPWLNVIHITYVPAKYWAVVIPLLFPLCVLAVFCLLFKYNASIGMNLEENLDTGTIDPSIPASDISCSGCGAKLHCKDASLPGFLPFEIFADIAKKKIQESILCRRCYLLKNHDFLVNVNVCDVDYRSMMEHLKLREDVLILLISDMTDLPFSFYPGLSKIIGDRKPMIVIGNKIDLLPPDYKPGYLRYLRNVLIKTANETGFSSAFNILHFALISAKTGFGVEDLITNIHLKWTSKFGALRNDVYIVGCTNAGKSTLFNTFLRSDLCKVRALDLVERATASIWPGTTISLLKFPIMKVAPHRLEIRRRRLLSNRKWEYRESKLRRMLLVKTGDPKYAVLQANVDNSYKIKEEELQPISVLDVKRSQDSSALIRCREKIKLKAWNPDDPIFADGNWCYDTPGTVNSEQILNLFTLEELIEVVPRQMLLPRSFIVYSGQTLLIGGVAQVSVLDIALQHAESVLLTVFASGSLPINVMATNSVPTFMEKYLGTEALVAPRGNADRIYSFPTFGMEAGAADLVLSSIGWVCVTANRGTVTIEGLTPAGKGLALRTPPILPYCAALRGKRISGTQAYKVIPLKVLLEPGIEKKSRNRQ
uniref:G domain-containing protein n=1 Tax=Syphacia muris TaxID=451379 RepID=A0A158R4G9_9BILA